MQRVVVGGLGVAEVCVYNNTITGPSMAADLSSPTANRSRLIVKTA